MARYGCSLLELSRDGKPSIICGAGTGAVLWIRHKSLTEQITTAVQCPWEWRREKEMVPVCLVCVMNTSVKATMVCEEDHLDLRFI